jgi:hypothetical protein
VQIPDCWADQRLKGGKRRDNFCVEERLNENTDSRLRQGSTRGRDCEYFDLRVLSTHFKEYLSYSGFRGARKHYHWREKVFVGKKLLVKTNASLDCITLADASTVEGGGKGTSQR